MKKLGVVITDGVGFRNFILSDFLVEAQHKFDEVVILSCLPVAVFKGHISCRVIELEVYQETFVTWFFRKAKELGHLQKHKKNNSGIQDNLKTNTNRNKSARGYATRALIKWTSLFNSENWVNFYNKLQQLSFGKNPITKDYIALLEREQIDLMFFTHQRPPYIAPLVYAAKKLHIKTTAFIFSWDNLASKGRMAASFDTYLVWSNLMKEELKQFYTSINDNEIKIVGTPQFEPYVLERYKMSKMDFISKFSIDPELKIICFSCGDISTSKNDEFYIQTIANAILQNEVEKVNLIVRTSPAEDPKRFEELAMKFPFILWNYPNWKLSREGHQESWSQRVPTLDDVKTLRALLEYCDININMLSTMSLDFMQFDKPVINPVFGNDENGLYNDQRFLKYPHIKNVLLTGATRIVKDKVEFIDAIKLYLNNPMEDAVNRQNLISLQIGCPLEGTGKRIAGALLQWA